MIDPTMRIAAFLSVAAAFLNAGYHFHSGNEVATLFFMTAAIALALVTEISVRKKRI